MNRFSTPGSEAAKKEILKNAQLLVKIGKTDVAANLIDVKVDGFEYAPADRHLTHTGALAAPVVDFTEENTGVFSLTPSWKKVDNADFYEIEYGGMLYSTIRDTEFTIDGLEAETDYAFKVRAVNKDGYSDWSKVSATTKSNPLEFAIKNIKAQNSAEDQPGQGINKMFDFDERVLGIPSGVRVKAYLLTSLLTSVRLTNSIVWFTFHAKMLVMVHCSQVPSHTAATVKHGAHPLSLNGHRMLSTRHSTLRVTPKLAM